MPKTVIITAPVFTPAQVVRATALRLYPDGRRAPSNLDAFADMLREYRVDRLVLRHNRLSDLRPVALVCEDCGVELRAD
ncbi:hypothetical protein [Corynebacterium renale]|uniref:Uncharacterized protein n=1 Tax=Corynebacterium renale TaxID=1724 RepID=A0A2A9DQW6_9CORY|nr:hypothetical protein [Corynebacterium renale]PFG28309.1 hypothetical protein ATK06_1412 [Corynebacterium renale]SQI19168.1 Uncharacterised protein [Corynebacterium renale]